MPASNGGTSLQWTDVNYELPPSAVGPGRRTKILSGFSGQVQPGRLVCMLGPSGSGKTTLLNILAGRVKQSSIPGSHISGCISINGKTIDPVQHRRQFAYVMAEDALMWTMTPKECFRFAADLRLPPGGDKDRKCDELLETLGLQKCAHTLVGNEMNKGVSSGEKKRTAVGVEIITDPNLVFLDEPTSGLDSHTAFKLVTGPLRTLADQGKAVLCTIHQPSSETFFSFDDCLILTSDGRCMYFGPTGGLLKSHFRDAGYPCPDNYNPADHALLLSQTLSSSDLDKLVSLCEERMLNPLKKEIESIRKHEGEEQLPDVYTAPISSQMKLLLQREARNFIRDRGTLAFRYLGTIFLACCTGLVFFQAGDGAGEEQMISRGHFGGLIMFTINGMFATAMAAMVSFPYERPVFLRQYNAGMYYVAPYFISKALVEFPAALVQAFLGVSINYLLMGFVGEWALLVVGLWLVAISAASIGVCMGCLLSDVKKAMEVSPLLFIPQIMFGGFFIKVEMIPVSLRWLQYIFPLKYALNLMMTAEFEDLPGGTALLEENSVNPSNLWSYVCVLLAITVCFRLIGMLGLKSRAKKALF